MGRRDSRIHRHVLTVYHGKFLIGLYLGKATFASTYGAAASVVILIVWVYYSAQIFFFGAAFTKVYADHFGASRIRKL